MHDLHTADNYYQLVDRSNDKKIDKNNKNKIKSEQIMVIATPVSNTDSLSDETIVGDRDDLMINSNSLESVPSIVNEVNFYILLNPIVFLTNFCLFFFSKFNLVL